MSKHVNNLWNLLDTVENTGLHLNVMLHDCIQHLLRFLGRTEERPLDANIAKDKFLEGNANFMSLNENKQIS